MSTLLRPRDFALLLLASRDLPTRQRARDQQADRAGLRLRRQVLSGLAARDPEPRDMEASLMGIVAEMETPPGSTRAVATGIRDDWLAAVEDPKFLEHLLAQAMQEDSVCRRIR